MGSDVRGRVNVYEKPVAAMETRRTMMVRDRAVYRTETCQRLPAAPTRRGLGEYQPFFAILRERGRWVCTAVRGGFGVLGGRRGCGA